jgi:hypothetical protein
MFISIRRYSGVKPDAIEEVVRRVEAELVPQLSALPGFVAYYVLDESDGVLAAVSFFSNQSAAENANRLTASWVQERGVCLDMPPQITLGGVRVASPDFRHHFSH